MIHMYGIHRMREKNVMRYSSAVLGSLPSGSLPSRLAADLSVVSSKEGMCMLWTIFVILLILWFLGMVSSYTLAGYIHILLLIAVVVLVINLVTGRRGAI
jgi:ABC-type multidrug transport system fused ATPase/permease subunit